MAKKKASKPSFSTAQKPRKGTTPKTRNAGTMTESAFWGFIRSSLRQKSRWWKPVSQAKEKAKRKYKGPNKRQKWEYQCATCSKWYPNTEINVDHIIPAGTLRCANDLPGFVERLFCEVDNLQVLCSTCHNIKTQKEKNAK
jgi:5-methylcytosine-specific restriction endonuclease McrA